MTFTTTSILRLTACCVILLAFRFNVHAQKGVGIGTADVDETAILQINAGNRDQGVALPLATAARVNTKATENPPMTPKEGLLIYDDVDHVMKLYNGTRWDVMFPVPQGGIIMWSGSSAPSGWVLCDGRKYLRSTGAATTASASSSAVLQTPDLRGRFIVGFHPTDANYAFPGNLSTGLNTSNSGFTGGESAVTLTNAEIPSHSHYNNLQSDYTNLTHSHSLPGQSGGDDSNHSNKTRLAAGDKGVTEPSFNFTVNSGTYNGNHRHAVTGNSNATGGGAPHENRPPYYTLAFIMKL